MMGSSWLLVLQQQPSSNGGMSIGERRICIRSRIGLLVITTSGVILTPQPNATIEAIAS